MYWTTQKMKTMTIEPVRQSIYQPSNLSEGADEPPLQTPDARLARTELDAEVGLGLVRLAADR